MALKALMLGQSIKMKENQLRALEERGTTIAAREAELEQAIAEVETDEQRAAVEAMVAEFDSERSAHEAELTAARQELDQLRAQLAELEDNEPPAPAQTRGAEHSQEVRTMSINFDLRGIRKLPSNERAFDALPFEERQRIAATPTARAFIGEIRSIISNQRAVTGADLTIPVEFLDIVRENMFRYSKLLNRVRVRVGRGVGRQTIGDLVPEAIWTECCGALNELTFGFTQIEVDCYKVGGYVPLCNSLKDESDLNLAGEVIEMISQSIGYAIDKAILYGRPSLKMPTGIVPSLAQTSQPSDWPVSGPSWTDLHTSNVITLDASLTGAAFWAALTVAAGNTFTRYNRGEMFWAMNSKTYALLRAKAVTATMTGEWVAAVNGEMPIISGNIDVLEFIPDGDIIGGYGDLYLLRRHSDTMIGADETGHYNRINDITLFWGKTRADGKPIIRGAFVAININGQTPTTELPFAGDIANDAALQSLTVGALSLSPSFDSDTMTYTASAANNVTSAAVTATPEQADAQIAITVTSGTTTKNVVNGGSAALAVGVNTITTTITKGGSTRVYTVTVTRAAS